MASPRQIANDLSAWARFFQGREKDLSALFADTARVLNACLDGDRIDGRTYYGLQTRLRNYLAGPGRRLADNQHLSLVRGQDALTEARQGRADAA
jgi:hypothetical protein